MQMGGVIVPRFANQSKENHVITRFLLSSNSRIGSFVDIGNQSYCCSKKLGSHQSDS